MLSGWRCLFGEYGGMPCAHFWVAKQWRRATSPFLGLASNGGVPRLHFLIWRAMATCHVSTFGFGGQWRHATSPLFGLTSNGGMPRPALSDVSGNGRSDTFTWCHLETHTTEHGDDIGEACDGRDQNLKTRVFLNLFFTAAVANSPGMCRKKVARRQNLLNIQWCRGWFWGQHLCCAGSDTSTIQVYFRAKVSK